MRLRLLLATLLMTSSMVAQFSEVIKMKASDALQFSDYGRAVDLSGDYAIVGAIRDTDSGLSSGAAYILFRSQGQWIEQQKLKASNTSSNDMFSIDVAISGDYAVVGANGVDHDVPAAGSVYVFKRSGTTWVEQAELTIPNASSLDQLGISVTISGDYIIAGTLEDDAGDNSGSAYVFVRNGDSWIQQTKLTASDAAAGDRFGGSLDLCGEYAIIGTDSKDGIGQNSGAAYIFKRTGSTWSEQAKLLASDEAEKDLFGEEVAISGDYAIVGAIGNDDAGSQSGSAYIFSRDGTTWTEQAKLTAADAEAGDNFGRDVDIRGDDVIVGAHSVDAATTINSGSAYIFKRSDATWIEQQKITASDPVNYDFFGSYVAISEEYVLVGNPSDDEGGNSSGAVYIFEKVLSCNLEPPIVYLDQNGMATIDTAQLTIQNFGLQDTVFITTTMFNCDDVESSPILDSLVGVSGGITTVCTFEISILDTIPPTITCHPGNFYLSDTSPNIIDPFSISAVTDNCTIDTIYTVPEYFDCNQLGLQMVQVIAVDAFNNRDTSMTEITVIDSIAPIVQCRDTMIQLNEAALIALTANELILDVQDNCSINATDISMETLGCNFVDSVFNVRVSVFDSGNNMAECDSEISLVDPHGYCCSDSLNIAANPIDPINYYARDFISGTGTISSTDTVNFHSLQIRFDPLFQIEQGAIFKASNEDCNE